MAKDDQHEFITQRARDQLDALTKTVQEMSEYLRVCEPAVIYGMKLLEDRTNETYWRAMEKTVERWKDLRAKERGSD